jgi:hypothetical protein
MRVTGSHGFNPRLTDLTTVAENAEKGLEALLSQPLVSGSQSI